MLNSPSSEQTPGAIRSTLALQGLPIVLPVNMRGKASTFLDNSAPQSREGLVASAGARAPLCGQ